MSQVLRSTPCMWHPTPPHSPWKETSIHWEPTGCLGLTHVLSFGLSQNTRREETFTIMQVKSQRPWDDVT